MVYFIQGELTGLIKIGWTVKAIKHRLIGHQTGSPDLLKVLKTVNGSRNYESHLHETFKHLAVRGEWFKPEEDLLRFIKRQEEGIRNQNRWDEVDSKIQEFRKGREIRLSHNELMKQIRSKMSTPIAYQQAAGKSNPLAKRSPLNKDKFSQRYMGPKIYPHGKEPKSVFGN